MLFSQMFGIDEPPSEALCFDAVDVHGINVLMPVCQMDFLDELLVPQELLISLL